MNDNDIRIRGKKYPWTVTTRDKRTGSVKEYEEFQTYEQAIFYAKSQDYNELKYIELQYRNYGTMPF